MALHILNDMMNGDSRMEFSYFLYSKRANVMARSPMY